MRQATARRQARWLASAQQRGWPARCLWPLSLLYAALMRLRRWLYAVGIFKTERLPVPVIVVGNVVVGGAGKTPTVVALVQQLRALGWQPGVVSRGFGRNSSATLSVQTGTPVELCGDEPALIQRATGVPVFVGARRADAARALLQAHPQVDLLLCDDGLQHLALGRDLSVVVFDERGSGNGWQLPAGLLRETWPGAYQSSAQNTLVLRQHREGHAATALPLASGLAVFDAVRRLGDRVRAPDGSTLALAALQGLSLTALAGIARPQAFFDMLRARGLQIEREVALPDHADLSAYGEWAQHPGPLVCTEKDAVKLFAALSASSTGATPSVWAVALKLQLDETFFSAVLARLPGTPRKP
jgi:tetraacyldisaccharide 4'-kinase